MGLFTRILVGTGLAAGVALSAGFTFYMKRQVDEADKVGSVFSRGTTVMCKLILPMDVVKIGSKGDIVEFHGVSMGSDLDDAAASAAGHRLLVLWTSIRISTGEWLFRRRYAVPADVSSYLGTVVLNSKPDLVPSSEPDPAKPINKAGVKTRIAVKTEPTMITLAGWPSVSMDVNALHASTAHAVASDIDLTSFGA